MRQRMQPHRRWAHPKTWAFALLALLTTAIPGLARDDLGDEAWLQYGPHQWGYQYRDEMVLLDGTWVSRLLMINYPSDVEGEEVPVASSAAPYPVVFFQHAGGSHYRDYDYLFSRLASHGIIVVSMDHTDSWFEGGDDFWYRHLLLFANTIDDVFAWNEDPGSLFYDAVDAERICLAGHSHGAAFIAMREYAPMNPEGEFEIDCVWLLAPCPDVPMGDYLDTYAGMPPLLVVYGSRDQDYCVAHGQSIAIYEPGDRPRHFSYVVGGSHYGFTDEGSLGAATITRTEHHRVAVSSIVAYLAYMLGGDESALPYLRGDHPLLDAEPEVRYQYHDPVHLAVDHFEDEGDSSYSAAIVGIPDQTFINGFLSDTFVDFTAGVDLVQTEIQRLLPDDPPEPYRVLYYEDYALGTDVYGPALAREVLAGRIQEPVATASADSFAVLIDAEPWDLIVSARQNGSSSDMLPCDGPLAEYICTGGKAIISDFRIHSATADDVLHCSQSEFDGSTNWMSMTSTGDLFTDSLEMYNPGWGIATYGLRTDAVVYATNEFPAQGDHDPLANSLGHAVIPSGMSTFTEGFMLEPARTLFHPTWGLEFAWEDPGASFRTMLTGPESPDFDAGAWDVLSFRILQLHNDPLNPAGQLQDLHVRLVGTNGSSAELALADAPQGALRYATPPGPGTDWKSVFETYRFPLAEFWEQDPSLDPAHLRNIDFVCDLTPTGRIFIDDLEFATMSFPGAVLVDDMRAWREGTVCAINGAYPTPAAGTVRIDYATAARERFSVRVHDVNGRLIRTLFEGPVAAGTHAINWDRRDLINARVAAGIYFVRVTAGRFQDTQRIVLVD